MEVHTQQHRTVARLLGPRFFTFVVANAVPDQRKSQVFMTNQTATIYEHLVNLTTQQNPPKDISELAMEEIVKFMKEEFDLNV